MFRSLIKIFLPKATSLASLASEKITEKINTSKKNEVIAEYSKYVSDISEITKQLSDMLYDGNIDNIEKEKLTEILTPLFEKAIDLI
jgi:hypothetical protein